MKIAFMVGAMFTFIVEAIKDFGPWIAGVVAVLVFVDDKVVQGILIAGLAFPIAKEVKHWVAISKEVKKGGLKK